MIVLSEEDVMLKDMANGWTADRAPVPALRALRGQLADTGFDPALYAEMAEMGWPAILIPEEFGGVGMNRVSLGLIAEELGRNLVGSPLVWSAAGAVSALTLGTNQAAKEALLPQIANGSLAAALAIDDENHHRPHTISTTAQKYESGWVLSGAKRAVPDATGVGLLVIAAQLEDTSPALFSCPVDTAGVTLTSLDRIDSRGAADIVLDNVSLGPDALLGQGQDYLDTVLDSVRAILAAEMLGGTAQAFETTVEYMKTRIQFDQPIGSFQALQHRAADMLGEIVLARAAVYGALQAIDAGDADASRQVSLAKAIAGDCFRTMAREMIQIHGGIGMTDEHDAGLYLKRAHVLDHTLGNAAFHRERYARMLDI
ncbi:hypothetical protein MB02_10025 [Croceicoccus estronivorus]|uniref:acyl-CoA dehydrogenase family protein n=1 Tax=Croceicoccus estronivorus TaxID=1172626 RepID=UPI00083209BF|nr:acyl-CoA dehydrogenase family protein [Croceicoccus estronivorus]OCC23517.1 hypothetical protein MB02_10025 [Croceicoccus estronivorus]